MKQEQLISVAMPAIPAYIPFILLSFFYIKIDVYYSGDSSNNFHLYLLAKEGIINFNKAMQHNLNLKLDVIFWASHYYCLIGYKVKTLYAEMETVIFSKNDSNNSLLVNLDRVRIFWEGDENRKYFQFDEITEVVKTTSNSWEASIFSLITTTELHADGQFKIQYTTANITADSSLESYTPYEIVMQLSIAPGVTQHGPYQLGVVKGGANQTGLFFEVQGISSSLP